MEGIDLEQEYVIGPETAFRRNINVLSISDEMNNAALKEIAEKRRNEIKTNPIKVEEEMAWKQFAHYDLQVGIISLTKYANNPVMWGHYGKNDTGFVVGFSLKNFLMQMTGKTCQPCKVKYKTDRPKVKDFRSLSTAELVKGWSYENEYRILLNRKDHEESPTFDSVTTMAVPEDCIKEVIFGSKICPNLRSTICHVTPAEAKKFISKPSLRTYFHTIKPYST